jgi:hypothetical protein
MPSNPASRDCMLATNLSTGLEAVRSVVIAA